jgi:hypothetical protein
MVRRVVRVVLLVVGLGCAVVFFSVNGTVRPGPAGDETHWVIGFQPSPWLRYDHGADGFQLLIVPLSWSWLFGAAALVAFNLYHRLGRRPALADGPAGPPPPSSPAS